MHRKHFLTLAAALLLCAPLAARAQDAEQPCHENNSGHPHACEVRELTLAATGKLDVDAGMNGGIAVEGSDRADISVRAVINTNANTEAEAKDMLQRVKISAEGGRIRASGPESKHYSVSFKISAPRNTSVDLHAFNGGIMLSDLNGTLHFETTNGGLHLTGLAGDVKGQTTNGGIHVVFDGARWNGGGVDLRTTNGGIRATMPGNFAAHLDASTVNGGLHVDMPITMSGHIKNNISADLNGGGPTIHLETVNGGVSIGSERD
jgi:DUF4097 and DUF4098 domain-containing protein YvlB